MVWLTNWNRRKQITVNGSAAGTISDYQMKLTVNQASGTDSAGIVNLGGDVLTTFNDLRFTKSDGNTILSYWIESITGTTPNQIATVWIKLAPSPDTIPASPGTYNFYIYYNNTGASAASNGTNTFVFFDDFNRPDSATVGNGWTESESNGAISSIYANQLKLYSLGANSITYVTQSHTGLGLASFAIDVNMTISVISGSVNIRAGLEMQDGDGTDGTNIGAGILDGGWTGYKTGGYDGTYHELDVVPTVGTPFIYSISYIPSQKVKIYIDYVEKYTLTGQALLSTPFNGRLFQLSDNSGQTITTYWNDYRVRKYTSPEPTFYTTGSEELTTQAATGGMITTSGSYRIHAFTSSGIFTVNKSMNVDVLVIGGGGGGGSGTGAIAGGGGGAGQYTYHTTHAATPQSYSITIGNGGAGANKASAAVGANGTNSVFDTMTSVGGGGGAADGIVATSGASGGGGSGRNDSSLYGASGTAGYKGGDGLWSLKIGGGGGGISAAGANAIGSAAGNGGNGTSNDISGSSVTYGGGGGGGASNYSGVSTPGSGGTGGGGNGGTAITGSLDGINATVNSGSGGGGGGWSSPNNNGSGGNGGTGIVIISYLSSEDVTAYSMSLHPSETPCRTGICTVRADATWQNLGSSSITFRPTILVDGTTYIQAASDITIDPYPAISSTIQITTPTLAVGTHSICPYPN